MSEHISNKKYARDLKELEGTRAGWARERQLWLSEKSQLMERVEGLARQMSSQRTFLGQNQLKTSEYDSYQMSNNHQLKHLIVKVFSVIKFVPPSFFRFDPQNDKSFFSRAAKDMEIPTGHLEEAYWVSDVVPMAGKLFQELRSKAASGHLVQYLSKCHAVLSEKFRQAITHKGTHLFVQFRRSQWRTP